jgi:hypothetical protein
MFAALAKTWRELAADLENSQMRLDTCSVLRQPYRFTSRTADNSVAAADSYHCRSAPLPYPPELSRLFRRLP